jgi:hypothetical protein
VRTSLLQWVRSLLPKQAVLDDFERVAERYRERIVAHRPKRIPPLVGAKVGVVVSPWQRTAVPFYSVEWAIRLRLEGLRVEFIWDTWPHVSGEPTPEEVAISRVLRAAKSAYGIGIATPLAGDGREVKQSEHLDLIAFETVTRNLGKEPLRSDPAIAEEAQRLGQHATRVEQLLAARGYDWILLPGGVWGASGAYWNVCEAAGIGLTTFDSGQGLLLFQHGGPAAHLPDLLPVMQALSKRCEQDEMVRRNVAAWVDDRLTVRRRGEDEFRLQPANADRLTRKVDVVVPLNYRLDTAAMCRQRLFPTVNDWLHALVEWAKNRPHVDVVIRQHPCEKIPAFRSKEDYSWVCGPNVRLVVPEDSINTYDLLANCRVVLPHSSRVGMEAAVMGKSVILAAHTYYEKMAFARMPESPDAYFAEIDEALNSKREQDVEERRSAYAAYYVAENFGIYKTDFTPIPADFESWAQKSPAELWSDEQNATFLAAAVDRVPAAGLFLESVLQHWADFPSASDRDISPSLDAAGT